MKPITEKDGVHQSWYKERPRTPEELAAFVTKLLTEYRHDYGTICHAVAASAIAAARTVDASNQGGITGFQAGCVLWEFIKNWMSWHEQPMKLVRVEHMLYPQYERDFDKTIKRSDMEWLVERAKKELEKSDDFMVREVREHMERIAEGIPPFGYRVVED